MIKIENVETYGWEAAIRGMRNPMNSWDKSDSGWTSDYLEGYIKIATDDEDWYEYRIGPNDQKLMKTLAKAGSTHAKYRRMIMVSLDITAPLYWWKEFDTYKVGTVANSCSTMHKIAAKEFELDDFSHEHLFASPDYDEIPDFENDEDIIQYKKLIDEALKLMREGKEYIWPERIESAEEREVQWHYNNGAYFAEVECDIHGDMDEWVETKYALDVLTKTIEALNYYRKKFLETKDKRYWWQMIQLLPSSYNQKRTVMLNYEILSHMYHDRKDHKLDEWRDFCKWIETLPFSEIITGEEEENAV